MKVWYCHPYAGSEKLGMSLRPFYLVKNLNKLGVEGLVIGASFHHLFRTTPDSLNYHEANVHFKFIRVNKYKGNGVGRIINMFLYSFGFLSPLFWKSAFQNKPEIIIVSSAHPFHFLPLFFLSKAIRAKLVFEVRDLWPLSLKYLMKISESHPFYKVVGWLEKFAYRKSDLVISLLEHSKNHMVTKGLEPSKFFHLPNGVEIPNKKENYNEIKHFELLQKFANKYSRILMYTGAHGIPNALELYIEAAHVLQKDNINVGFVFIGEGSEKENLLNLSKSYKLHNVIFLESIPKSEIAQYLMFADVCVIGAIDSKLYKYGISPNKIFDYMLAKKTILSTIPSSSNPITDSGCGWQLSDASLVTLVDKIKYLVEMDNSDLDEMGVKGWKFVTKYHSYQSLSIRLKAKLESLI